MVDCGVFGPAFSTNLVEIGINWYLPMEEMRRKICVKCEVEKMAFEFNIDSKSHDGIKNICKECTRKAYHESNRKKYPPSKKDYCYPPL